MNQRKFERLAESWLFNSFNETEAISDNIAPAPEISEVIIGFLPPKEIIWETKR